MHKKNFRFSPFVLKWLVSLVSKQQIERNLQYIYKIGKSQRFSGG